MELQNEIIKLLKNSEPMKAGEISEALKTDKKEVEKAIKKLKDEGKIDSPKRCYYGVKA